MTARAGNADASAQRSGCALGQEHTVGLITVRIAGSDLVEIVRKGVAGGRRMERQLLWGAEDIFAAHLHAQRRRDKDGQDQERALRWAIDTMGLRQNRGRVFP